MSERYNKAFESLHLGENQITEADYQEQRRKVEEDMIAGIEESISLGWLTQDEGDQMIYDWMQTYRPCQD